MFNLTGIELEDLQKDTELYKLEDDEEYQQMYKEYGEKIENLQKA